MTNKLIRFAASIFFCLVFISTSFYPALAAPPSNDNFADAAVIMSLPFSATVDITEATFEPGENWYCSPFQNTAWFSFTPAQDVLVQIDMDGSAIESSMTLYSAWGSGPFELNFLGCIRNNDPTMFTAQAGQTYYFQVAPGWYSYGNVNVNLVQIPPPANDNFENATPISLPLPFDDTVDLLGATIQPGERGPTCSYDGIYNSIWYSFTPETAGTYSAVIPSTTIWSPIIAVYTGSSLENLTQLSCQSSPNNLVTVQAEPGTTYYFQVGKMLYWDGNQIQFHLDIAPPPTAEFNYYPGDPSIFDTILFLNFSHDPANIGIQTSEWNFGDGSTSNEVNVYHRYTADGDYQVTLKVTTPDGRTASTTKIVPVRTHDVAITKVLAPKAASAGQTREIYVYLKNTHYQEDVNLVVYKSVPGGTEWVGSMILTVPVLSGNRQTVFSFRYTFTEQDAQVGKVSFQVSAAIGARDAYPMDNWAISSPTRVSR